MANSRGIFVLKDVARKKIANLWSNPCDVWVRPDVGPAYTLCGVREGDLLSTVPYSWFGGGSGSGPSSTVDRIDYANDTSTASVKGPLSAARRELAATTGPTVSFV